MQRNILATLTRIAINPHIFCTNNTITLRFKSTARRIIAQIETLPVYNVNKLSLRDIDAWNKITSEIISISSLKRPNISNVENSTSNGSTLGGNSTLGASDEKDDSTLNAETNEVTNDATNVVKKASNDEKSINDEIKHIDYIEILSKLCDRGYNDVKFYSYLLSNLRNKFERLRSPAHLTQFLSVLYRCKVRFKSLINNCIKTLDNEMESRIGSVFLDREHIQQLLNNLLKYMTVTEYNDKLIVCIHELIIDGYDKVPISILIDLLYNLSVCYNDKNGIINVLSYQEHDHNTPKQHFLTPISRLIHKHQLRPIEKTKLFRCYVLFGFDHITFTQTVLSEIIELLKKSVDFEDFDHHNAEYLCGFTRDMDNYTKGQILMVADSLLLSRRHHFTPCFRELVQLIYFNCLDVKQIEKFDPVELRCAMTIIGNSVKYINPDNEILSEITKHMINHLECNRVDFSNFAIFLKDLVRSTRIKLVKKNQRNRTIRITKFPKLVWINESTEHDKSLLERISKQLNTDIDIVNLTHCLRSIAYLGFNNKEYYEKFLGHFRQNVDKLPPKCIAYIEQTLNKVKIVDKHTFYLLGKKFQESQLDLASNSTQPKILLRRIG